MRYLKAFLTGIFFPSLVVPLLLVFLVAFGHRVILENVTTHFIALVWGLWNVFYIAKLREFLFGAEMLRAFIAGALLGLIVAAVGVLGLDLPGQLGVVGSYRFFPFLGVPIIYGLVWAFVVSPLNRAVGIEDV